MYTAYTYILKVSLSFIFMKNKLFAVKAESKSYECEMDACLKLKGAMDSCLEKLGVLQSITVRYELWWWGTLILISQWVMTWKRRPLYFCHGVTTTIPLMYSMKISHRRVMALPYPDPKPCGRKTDPSVMPPHRSLTVRLWADRAEQFQMSLKCKLKWKKDWFDLEGSPHYHLT